MGMEEEDEEKYKAHFAKYIEHGIGSDDVEDMYKEAHTKIRENPEFEPKSKEEQSTTRKGNKICDKDGKYLYTRNKKISMKERKNTVAQKIQSARKALLAGADD